MEKDNNKPDKNQEFDKLVIDDDVYITRFNKMHRQRKPYEPINASNLKSFMPGNIPEVFIKRGDHIKEGDLLLILEAMKMKNQIMAPFDATVLNVNVKVGDKVPKNHVLVELKPIEIT